MWSTMANARFRPVRCFHCQHNVYIKCLCRFMRDLNRRIKQFERWDVTVHLTNETYHNVFNVMSFDSANISREFQNSSRDMISCVSSDMIRYDGYDITRHFICTPQQHVRLFFIWQVSVERVFSVNEFNTCTPHYPCFQFVLLSSRIN